MRMLYYVIPAALLSGLASFVFNLSMAQGVILGLTAGILSAWFYIQSEAHR